MHSARSGVRWSASSMILRRAVSMRCLFEDVRAPTAFSRFVVSSFTRLVCSWIFAAIALAPASAGLTPVMRRSPACSAPLTNWLRL